MNSVTGYIPAFMGLGVAVAGYAAARLIRWKAHRDILARERQGSGEGVVEAGAIILQHAE